MARWLPFLIAVAFFSCKTRKAPTMGKQPVSVYPGFLLSLERTPCYGTCPIYKYTVDSTGKADYLGIRFVEMEGRYVKKLSREQMEKLKAALDKADVYAFADAYDNSGISDLPSSILTYTTAERTKKIVCRMDCPAAFRNLFKELEQIVGQDGFTKVPEPE